MADTGFLIAGGSSQSSSSGGSLEWDTTTLGLGYLHADDGLPVEAQEQDSEDQETYFLISSSHGAAVPVDATINGIEFLLNVWTNGGTSSDFLKAYAVKGGTIQSTDLETGTGAISTSSTATKTYGGATEMWGTTWTPAEVNASGFGFAFACTVDADNDVYVDAVWVKIHYTEAPEYVGYEVTGAVSVALTVNQPVYYKQYVAGSLAVAFTVNDPTLSKVYTVSTPLAVELSALAPVITRFYAASPLSVAFTVNDPTWAKIREYPPLSVSFTVVQPVYYTVPHVVVFTGNEITLTQSGFEQEALGRPGLHCEELTRPRLENQVINIG